MICLSVPVAHPLCIIRPNRAYIKNKGVVLESNLMFPSRHLTCFDIKFGMVEADSRFQTHGKRLIVRTSHRSQLSRRITTYKHVGTTFGLQKRISQLPAVDMWHAPAKLPSKLHMFAYVDVLTQSLCSLYSHCAVCTVTVQSSEFWLWSHHHFPSSTSQVSTVLIEINKLTELSFTQANIFLRPQATKWARSPNILNNMIFIESYCFFLFNFFSGFPSSIDNKNNKSLIDNKKNSSEMRYKSTSQFRWRFPLNDTYPLELPSFSEKLCSLTISDEIIVFILVMLTLVGESFVGSYCIHYALFVSIICESRGIFLPMSPGSGASPVPMFPLIKPWKSSWPMAISLMASSFQGGGGGGDTIINILSQPTPDKLHCKRNLLNFLQYFGTVTVHQSLVESLLKVVVTTGYFWELFQLQAAEQVFFLQSKKNVQMSINLNQLKWKCFSLQTSGSYKLSAWSSCSSINILNRLKFASSVHFQVFFFCGANLWDSPKSDNDALQKNLLNCLQLTCSILHQAAIQTPPVCICRWFFHSEFSVKSDCSPKLVMFLALNLKESWILVGAGRGVSALAWSSINKEPSGFDSCILEPWASLFLMVSCQMMERKMKNEQDNSAHTCKITCEIILLACDWNQFSGRVFKILDLPNAQNPLIKGPLISWTKLEPSQIPSVDHNCVSLFIKTFITSQLTQSIPNLLVFLSCFIVATAHLLACLQNKNSNTKNLEKENEKADFHQNPHMLISLHINTFPSIQGLAGLVSAWLKCLGILVKWKVDPGIQNSWNFWPRFNQTIISDQYKSRKNWPVLPIVQGFLKRVQTGYFNFFVLKTYLLVLASNFTLNTPECTPPPLSLML
ncbi:hypothetical protein VP01_1506g2 [Puccinia sorghi]|uniref:Uncharacterized protein n=1 Tax=Puccinia sorghi TaxID=27349 RepID=A0A0L6VJ16_9BASI|nr:hypothetical protein VP01_1506g2 [Puccinia sorghi]